MALPITTEKDWPENHKLKDATGKTIGWVDKKQQAAYIVRACNSYEQMREALEDIASGNHSRIGQIAMAKTALGGVK